MQGADFPIAGASQSKSDDVFSKRDQEDIELMLRPELYLGGLHDAMRGNCYLLESHHFHTKLSFEAIRERALYSSN